MEFKHKSVLLEETIDNLNIKPDGIYVDGTIGGAGHALKVCERLSDKGRLIGFDQDADAIHAAGERLCDYADRVTVIRSNYCHMREELEVRGITQVDGILLDLGVSSFQLDSPDRGFTYRVDAPLDMRMSREGVSAADLVNTMTWQELARVISRYGEDRNAVRIAKGIVKAREEKPIATTLQLADIIRRSVPAAVRREPGHPARKTFQALRIQVNGELDNLSRGLDTAFELLRPDGRLAVITFHSLEDRIVKRRMNDWCTGCICPPDFPVCVCGRKPRAELLYKRGISPSEQEVAENPRSRSARLRVCTKL